ncbi:MAG: hypothetical protein AB1806_03100 [Acidobacteriota bacterium]
MRMLSVVVSLLALAFGVAAVEGTGQPAADSGFAVVFYSGRGGNDDIYLLRPGEGAAEPDEASGPGPLPGRLARRDADRLPQ